MHFLFTVNTVGGFFANGQFFTPDSGVYLLSMSVRCETSACDVTMRLVKTIVITYIFDWFFIMNLLHF